MKLLKWAVGLAGGTVLLAGMGTVVLAADRIDEGSRTEQGPVLAEQNWQIGFTPSYSTGKFGSNTTSSFFYAPLSIRRLFRDGDVTLIIPFVIATTDGSTTLVGGRPVVVQDNHGGNSGPGGGGGCDSSGEDKPSCLTGRAPGQKVTTAGLGDIILKGRYYVLEENEYLPLIAVTGRMKVPTASASQGLGTGEFDYGFGAEVSKMLGDKWIAFLDGGYNIIGQPDGLTLQSQHWFDVGGGYYFTRDLLVSVYYEEYRAITPGFVNARDLFFAMNYTVSSALRFNGGVTLGLSDGAPDYAVTMGTSYRF